MIETIKKYAIIILAFLSIGLFYFNYTLNNRLAEKNNIIKTSQDTLHIYKSTIGNQGVFISNLQGNRNDILNELNSRKDKSKLDSTIIDSLKKDKSITNISGVNTITKIEYKHILDSSQRKVNLQDSIKTRWYDAFINIKNDSLGVKVDQRDQLALTQKLKKNKGLWTGSTLTTYANSLNPNTNVVGLTSVSTVVNKPSISIRPAIGFGLNSDIKGSNIRVGWNAGIVITLK